MKDQNQKELLSQDLKNLLIKQLAQDLYNHNLYRSLAVYFHSNKLFKLKLYCNLQAVKKLDQHYEIYNYLVNSQCIFTFPNIKEVIIPNNYLDIFKLLFKEEHISTKNFYEILNSTQLNKDLNTLHWLFKENKYLENQIKEEFISEVILDLVNLENDWFENEKTIIKYIKYETKKTCIRL